ncbi:MAG: acetyltransferase [Bacteroidetes bacterium]|jgi:Kdo2-lipid IVA lauroyltransferase/acyltransferase|nr:acetyltransferase [Bacteroidota bacterium]
MKKINDTFGYYIFYVFATLLALMPLSLLYVISDVLALIVHRVVRYRLKVVRTNLRNSFPEKTGKELRVIETRFYRHLCDYSMELMKMTRISDKELDKRISIDNFDLLYEQLDKGKNVILLLGHYGNWDWLSTLERKFKPGIRLAAVYRPLKNPSIDELFIKARERFGTFNIPKNNTLRAMIRIKQSKIPHVVAMVSDQTPSSSNLEYWTTFLNQDTPVLTGMDRIARQLDFAVYYIDSEIIKRGYYKATLSVIENDPVCTQPYEICERFIRKMEQTIQRDPAYYLWSHKRWKYKREK